VFGKEEGDDIVVVDGERVGEELSGE